MTTRPFSFEASLPWSVGWPHACLTTTQPRTNLGALPVVRALSGGDSAVDWSFCYFGGKPMTRSARPFQEESSEDPNASHSRQQPLKASRTRLGRLLFPS